MNTQNAKFSKWFKKCFKAVAHSPSYKVSSEISEFQAGRRLTVCQHHWSNVWTLQKSEKQILRTILPVSGAHYWHYGCQTRSTPSEVNIGSTEYLSAATTVVGVFWITVRRNVSRRGRKIHRMTKTPRI